MSLDGFVAGPNITVDSPMGTNGERLHAWMFTGSDELDANATGVAPSGIDAEIARARIAATGATIVGRTTFEVGVGEWRDVPYPAPSFVLTHRAREPLAMKSGTFTFVTDGLQSALEQAQDAAGERDVTLMGAAAGHQYLAVGLVDERYIHVAPILPGAGTRLFVGGERVVLRRTAMIESPHVTHLRYDARP